jgi:hypothetical protein
MATSRRSTENYLTENAIRAVKGPAYRALLPYEQLKSLPLAWAKHENWKIATAMSMDDLGNSDVATFLRDI